MIDPAKLMPDVRQPILIVQGGLDTQVEPPNADRLEALARKRKNAPPVEVVKVPGVNHLLVPATTGEVGEYADLKDKHVSPAVTAGDRDVAEQDALDRALATRPRATPPSRAGRPVLGDGDARRAARGARRPAAGGTDRSRRRHRRARARGGARPRHDDRSALLRLRHRRRAAGDGRRGMARRGLGSARQPLRACRPPAAVVEEVAAAWLIDLLGLPPACSVGFVTGCHMANFTALAAARHELLRRAGWDVEADGLQGAPPLRVVVGDEVHVSVIGALRHARHRLAADRRASPPTIRGGCSPTRSPRRSRAAQRPDDRLRAGRQREQRRVRSARRDRRRRQPASARGCTSTARSACGPPPAPALRHHVARHRARRLVGDRRAQVAERAVRLGPGVRRAPGGAPRGDEPHRRLSGAIAGGAARADGLGAGVVAPRARLRRLRGAALARPQRRRRSRRSLLPPGAAVRRPPAAGAGDPDPQRRRAEPGAGARRAADAATPTPRRERRCGACRRNASAGWAASRWHGMDAMRISVSNWSTTDEDVDRSADSIVRAVRQRA